jgi:hypothetical protein
MRAVLRVVALLIVIMVVVAVGATLKVEEECSTYTQRMSSLDPSAAGPDVSG